MFKWANRYGAINDTADILLADDDRTYELIDKIFATLSECFTTRKISAWTRRIWWVLVNTAISTAITTILKL